MLYNDIKELRKWCNNLGYALEQATDGDYVSPSCPFCGEETETHALSVGETTYHHCNGEIVDIDSSNEWEVVNAWLECVSCGFNAEAGKNIIWHDGKKIKAKEFFLKLNFVVLTGNSLPDN